ncbi:MAG: TadE/TadG family type IV pilus assembly protein [Salaquimonas sp.]
MSVKTITKSFARFLKNEAGNFAVVTAIAAPALLGTMALAVETTSLHRSRTQIQNALDIAALATGKELAVTVDEDDLEDFARDFFHANLHPNLNRNKVGFGFAMVDAPDAGKRIRLTADYDYPVTMKFLGMDEVAMDITAEVTAGNRTIEVAIVMDNSGSMGSYTGSSRTTRLEKAKEAATALSNQLFALANISNKPDPVKISVVPFGHSVNIGSQYRGASWMDMNGWSSIHHENIAWDSTSKRADVWPNLTTLSSGFKGSPNGSEVLPATSGVVNVDWLTRWTLFDALNEEWAGCVEMRPWPYHTTDDSPIASNGDTLFVPMFAPDEPDEDIDRREDDDYRNDYLDDYDRAYADPNPNSNDRLTETNRGAHYMKQQHPTEGWNRGNYTRQNWRQDWSMKYHPGAKNGRYNDWRDSNYGRYGPNMGCSTNPLTPLSDTPSTITDAIDDMNAGGYTNVQAGIVWGWRTLSNNLPFDGGRDYGVKENDKYIIVLTDGNNTYPSQRTYNYSEYTSWGYEKSDRVYEGITSNQSEIGAMNIHTETTCNNIKAIYDADNEPAYKIFTIAYDVSDGSSVKALLHSCASSKSDGSKYYYDVSGDALAAAMRAIGNEISDLRISQ